MTYPAHRSMYDRFDDPELLADEQAMQVDELDVEVIVADDHLTADQVVAKAQLVESALLRKTWPHPQRSFAETKRLVDRDLGILDAHVRAYHGSEHFIPF